MNTNNFLREVLEFYKWLFGGVWRAITAPFRWFTRSLSRAGGSNPLRFRPDLWALESEAKMAMDIQPSIIVCPKPWLALFSRSARKHAGLSLVDLIFLRVEIHTDSKRLVYSTSWFRNTMGKTYVIDLQDIQLPEQVNLPGVFWSELTLGLTLVTFRVRGSDVSRSLLLSRRGMWWPASLERPRGRRVTTGPGYAMMFKALAGWANTGSWS